MTLTRFARKSTHTNKSELGTATWDEFDARIRVRHSEHEVEYTPDVFDCFKVLDWDQETDEFGGDIGEYGDVRMSGKYVSSIRHLPRFLSSPRVEQKTNELITWCSDED